MTAHQDLVFDPGRAMAEAIGPEHGLVPEELSELGGRIAASHEKLAAARAAGLCGYARLHEDRDEAHRIKAWAGERVGRYSDVVVLGIGGSALGTIALQSAMMHPFHNLLPSRARGVRPRLFVVDNIDPEEVQGVLDLLTPSTTLFIGISKSGGTAETMSQLLIVRDWLEKTVGSANLSDQLVLVTDPQKGALREIAGREGLETFSVPAGVGGRFSVLSAVGLLPAALLGIDIDELLDGAARMSERCDSADLQENPAYLYAAILHLLNRKRAVNIAVMMPYARRLRDLADWYRQLLAESLGKKVDRSGKTVNTGITPVKALGVTDQHSQVQLYAEGPYDKVFTFLATRESFARPVMGSFWTDLPEVGYLAGRALGELRDAELEGTEWALMKAGRPTMKIFFPEITAHALGQFFYMMEHHIAMSGELLDIDAFDQPGVEAGKIAAFALMGREGYADRRAEIRGEQAGGVITNVARPKRP